MSYVFTNLSQRGGTLTCGFIRLNFDVVKKRVDVANPLVKHKPQVHQIVKNEQIATDLI